MKSHRKRNIKIISFFLASILSITFFVTGVNAKSLSIGKIDGFNQEMLGASWGTLEGLYNYGQDGDPGDISIEPGEEIRIPLTADLFTWDNNRRPLPREAVNLKELTRSGVQVRVRVSAGGKALDYIQFDEDVFENTPFKVPGSNKPTGKTAYISVMFAEELVDVRERDFSFSVYLRTKDKDTETQVITLSGTISNRETSVGEGDATMDISDATVVLAEDNLSDIKFELGNGVTIDRNLIKGRKYYGTAKIVKAEDFGKDDYWAEAYPDVILAVKLNTVNMRFGKSLVKLDPKIFEDEENKVYHVYGEDMSYYGTTKDELIYSDIYFISKKELFSFDQDQYTKSLESAPVSRKVTASKYENSENIDEAAIIDKKYKEEELQNILKFYQEANKSIAVVSSGHAVGIGNGEQLDKSVPITPKSREIEKNNVPKVLNGPSSMSKTGKTNAESK